MAGSPPGILDGFRKQFDIQMPAPNVPGGPAPGGGPAMPVSSAGTNVNVRHSTNYLVPLAAKQGVSSTTAQPNHTTPMSRATALMARADATITFATSIGANQPVATLFDRARGYDKNGQYVEVEGRAFPVSAYFISWLNYLLYHNKVVPGRDIALANATQTFAQYRIAQFAGRREQVSVQHVIKVQPYTGVGAASAYSENDGTSGEDDDQEGPLASFYVARAFGSGISAINIKRCRAFMLAAANDINSGFTIKRGGNTYVAEEINDIEERIAEVLGTTTMSITAAASAALRASRGQPQDPFTGAAVFLFSDAFADSKETVSITISTAQAVQVAALSDDGIGAISTT